jgi:predicted RecA/RadA family phage recombinase
MPIRASVRLEQGLRYPLIAGAHINEQDLVIFGVDDDTVLPAGVNDDLAFAIALQTVPAGKRVDLLLFGVAIVEMTVGTGGATRGKPLWKVADGVTDAPPNGGGTRSVIIVGRAMQSGIPKDRIGVLVNPYRCVSA